jgi:hypothetical protein
MRETPRRTGPRSTIGMRIDCDIHPGLEVPGPPCPTRHHWKEQAGNAIDRLDLTSYPPNMPLSCRPDYSRRKPASGAESPGAQRVPSFAICNPYGAQAVYPYMAASRAAHQRLIAAGGSAVTCAPRRRADAGPIWGRGNRGWQATSACWSVMAQGETLLGRPTSGRVPGGRAHKLRCRPQAANPPGPSPSAGRPAGSVLHCRGTGASGAAPDPDPGRRVRIPELKVLMGQGELCQPSWRTNKT